MPVIEEFFQTPLPGSPIPLASSGGAPAATLRVMTAESTLLLLVRHGETPTTGLVLPGRAPGLECDFGEWTGAALADLAGSPQWRTVQHTPSSFRFPGGESFTQMQARMVGVLEELRAAHSGAVVVCFSHADPIKAAVAHALGTHLDLFQRIVISPASVSAISYVDGQAPAVLMVNSTSEPLAGLGAP